MRGGRGGMGQSPRFRGGGRGFMGPGPSQGGHSGPSGHDQPIRARPPTRFHHWDDMHGMNEPEIFAETRMADGRLYYYNTRTRETMWERPEGPGVRIIRHEEVGKTRPSSGGPPIQQFDRGMHEKEPGPMGPMAAERNKQHFQSLPAAIPTAQAPKVEEPDRMPQPKEDSAPGTSPVAVFQGPPPAVQGQPAQNVQGQPAQNVQGQPAQNVQGPPPHGMIPPGMHQRFQHPGQNQSMLPPGGGPRMDGFNTGPMGPPSGFPPPGFMQGLPVGNPSFGMPPPGQFPATNFGVLPPWGFPPGMVPPTGVPPPVPDPIVAQIDPQLTALVAEWTEHIAPDGKMYYFSSKTQNSTWERPKVLIDFEAAKFQAQQRILAGQVTANTGGLASHAPQDTNEKGKAKKVEVKKVEKCRPVSSTPVSGTPWCVVWTGDKRVFFYNPATKTSVWERPLDLVGRTDVDEMVRSYPDNEKLAAKIKRAEATSTTSPLSDGSEKKAKEEGTKEEGIPEALSENTYPPGENISSEPPQKRVRTSSDDTGTAEQNTKAQGEVKESNDCKDGLKELTALEAEVKASRERATIPMEIRLKQFREMLIESNVSAFSTWEKELHKIVFDQRYLLLTSNERKKAFDRYVEQIVEEEKRERQNRLKETKEKFFQFLAEIKVSSKMNYNDFSQKYGRDDRFRCVDKSRDRENFFVEYLKIVQKKEREERAVRQQRERDDFLALLQEKVKDYHFSLSDMRKKLESDARFQVVDPETRDDIYHSFRKQLRQKQKQLDKQKKREREIAREQKEKNEKDGEGNEPASAEGKNSDSAPPTGTEDISEEEEGCITDDSDDEAEMDTQKKERVEQSIREREKQVQRSLASHLRDRDKERNIHRHEEAVQELQTLLTDVVRNVDMTWKEAKKVIKKDRRWNLYDVLTREEMEDLFMIHVDQISRKKRQRFKELLDERRVTSRTKWRDLYPKIKTDPRCTKFSSSERKCMREFDEYIREMNANMKIEFRELLKETKILNYKSFELLRQNANHMKEITSHLENDRRFLQLDNIPVERERLIRDYVEDLEVRGPPPPPTASEPARRK